MKGALLGRAPALLVNIRLGWKGLPGQTLLLIAKISKLLGKSLMTFAP
jgi:hypothetical protein